MPKDLEISAPKVSTIFAACSAKTSEIRISQGSDGASGVRELNFAGGYRETHT